ncbi:hypothetical protein DENSPDRAFT_885023 [Dentipellis sp. KUC8613]|nr:hypothetical protein DENSPDRAFT_885023 [Dentipellis sp. KUC8613]
MPLAAMACFVPPSLRSLQRRRYAPSAIAATRLPPSPLRASRCRHAPCATMHCRRPAATRCRPARHRFAARSPVPRSPALVLPPCASTPPSRASRAPPRGHLLPSLIILHLLARWHVPPLAPMAPYRTPQHRVIPLPVYTSVL